MKSKEHAGQREALGGHSYKAQIDRAVTGDIELGLKRRSWRLL
jgi:hypothetical protein